MVNDWMQLDMLRLNLTRAAWMYGYNDANPGIVLARRTQQGCRHVQVLGPDPGSRHCPSRHDLPRCFGYTKDTLLEMMLRGIMSYEVGAEGGLNIMRGIIARDEFGDEYNSFKP